MDAIVSQSSMLNESPAVHSSKYAFGISFIINLYHRRVMTAVDIGSVQNNVATLLLLRFGWNDQSSQNS
jgi:hypothetical protein